VLRFIAQRLSYANVMATVALFVTLGGTSYALARNSIGSRELRPRSVGASELKTAAVTARDVKNRSLRLSDMSLAAREALRGARGPAGPQGASGINYFTEINAAGTPTRGNATGSVTSGVNGRVISFATPTGTCAYSASLARVDGIDPPPGSTINVADNGDGRVLVRTWDAANVATHLPFHLIVAC
jgi:hypothetical protein